MKGQKERGSSSPYVLPTSQNPSHRNPPWLSHVCTTRKDLELEWLARESPETNPLTAKPKTLSHMPEQFSWVPLLCCSLPGHPFPIKSLALSGCVSPYTIYFQVLDNSWLFGHGRDPPSCSNNVHSIQEMLFWTMRCISMCTYLS